MLQKRSSGLLLHITSLPSAYGVGDLGPEAYRFADQLAEAKQSYWQILPLSPIEEGLGNSPYSSASAFAGNILLISLERLVDEGFLDAADIAKPPKFPKGKADYAAARQYKEPLLDKAFERFSGGSIDRHAYEAFCQEHGYWLEDYALFAALNRHTGIYDWSQWPAPIRDRTEAGLAEYRRELAREIEREKFRQWLFLKQWFELKTYCMGKGIQFVGDLPIYLNYHSADVWSHPRVFKLDAKHKPFVVSGVPPDYFSETGQLWGNPVYDWDYLRSTGYDWWLKRVSYNIHLFNLVRFDHFIGLVAFWEVDAKEKTAINGKWVDVPTADFLATLFRHHPHLPIIAEDLGIVTAEVRNIMRENGFPGMKVLLFAFGDDLPTNPYIVHNHTEYSIAYTGTHDNNTARGWFRKDADAATRERFADYIGQPVTEKTAAWQLIRLTMQSVARVAIFPVQDVLNLDEKARVNVPGKADDNWAWRLTPGQFTDEDVTKLGAITQLCGRQ